MKQVTQTLSTGQIEISEVPIPTLNDSFVLVQNVASVISAGTEKTKIDMGKMNLLQKAKARPDLVKQVLKKLKTEGFKKTYQTVNTRLTAPSPLGYSCAGKVIAAGGLVEGLQPGDRVACGGADYANHAEYVAVPKNLVVRVPDNVSDEEAAFTTVGAIAMQGVRLAEPLLGESFLVIGLGLLGQIAVQLLRANGCNVIATDLDASLVERARGYGALGIDKGVEVEAFCLARTGNHGVDGVLVCAGSSSNAIIELCGRVVRQKGRVVVVGAVPMDIPRQDYFMKEISVVISRSYGPGRYDPRYEEQGHDYPMAYVRFTEKRNMESFLDLLSQRKVDVSNLITHRFDIDEAACAYQLIEGKRTEPYIGIVVNYSPHTTDKKKATPIIVHPKTGRDGAVALSFLGAGNYATSTLLPPIMANGKATLNGLLTSSGRSAQGVAQRFGFAFCTDNLSDLLTENTDALVITSRHDSHASAAIAALEAGKHVYVEKPLGLSIGEIQAVKQALDQHPDCQLMVGFNRRFSSATAMLREHFAGVTGPMVVNIRINAGSIPSDHWIQDPEIGGGRIIGEACHFVDLAAALVGDRIKTVFASGTGKAEKSALLNDNCSIMLGFDNGSIATIVYTADGPATLPKEHVEMFGGGRAGQIDDFRSVRLCDAKSSENKRLPSQDKGQSHMIAAWLAGLSEGSRCVAPEILINSSVATVLAVESMMLGMAMTVEREILES